MELMCPQLKSIRKEIERTFVLFFLCEKSTAGQVTPINALRFWWNLLHQMLGYKKRKQK